MKTAITVENLSKMYVIGHQRQEKYVTLRDVTMHKLRAVSQRVRHPLAPNKEETNLEEFWALKDISLEIKHGDRIGIIGKNGAGKSTLLKILSRITEPSAGRISIDGRVASLLEVGTGFHNELTGRENVFLNGAVLGMSKMEIKQKFDEIVAFAEVEKFIDTPVKKYSSGMRVRLGFAVAAHLEPEILIIDEVLAVGDAEFQRKCLRKMEEVSDQGRTIIFVSHNMSSIRRLCVQAVLLEEGRLVKSGDTLSIVNSYLQNINNCIFNGEITEQMHSSESRRYDLDVFKVDLLRLDGKNGDWSVYYDETYTIRIHYEIKVQGQYFFSVLFKNLDGDLLAGTTSRGSDIQIISPKGFVDVEIGNTLVPSVYAIQILVKNGNELIDIVSGIRLSVKAISIDKNIDAGWGVTRINATWMQDFCQ